jgi:hypothetical protein
MFSETQRSDDIKKRGRVSLSVRESQKKEPRSLANYVPTTKTITPPVLYLFDKG